MKRLLYLLAFIPALLIGQKPAPLVDLSEYHDDNRLMEMTDWNFFTITNGSYQIPLLEVDSIHVGGVLIDDYLTVDSPTFVIDPVNNRVGIGTLTPDATFYITGSTLALTADIHNTQTTGIGAWQVSHEVSRASFGLAGSANAFVTPNSLAIYQQGHGPTYLIVDGNEDFIFSTDTSDAHALGYKERMRLTAAGSLNVQEILYTDSYWDDLRVPLTATQINPVNSEPDFEDMGNGAFAWGFDADNDSTYVLNFIAQIPHSYKEGTDLDAHIHWTPPTTNTGVVRWKLTYYLAAINDAITGPFYLWVLDAGDGTAYKHQLAEFGMIDGTGLGLSSMIIGNVTRTGDIGSDTYTGSAYGLELDFHFQIDSPGSREEIVK